MKYTHLADVSSNVTISEYSINVMRIDKIGHFLQNFPPNSFIPTATSNSFPQF